MWWWFMVVERYMLVMMDSYVRKKVILKRWLGSGRVLILLASS